MVNVNSMDELNAFSEDLPQSADHSLSALFIGFSRESAASLQTLMLSGNTSPRYKLINDIDAFSSSLSERSWDIILYSHEQTSHLKAELAAEKLQELSKDIPFLLLADPYLSEEDHSELLKKGIKPIFTQSQPILTLMYITQEIEQLNQRRRCRLLEYQLEKYESQIQLLTDDLRSAVCYLTQNDITYANESFFYLFGLDLETPLDEISIDTLITPPSKELFKEALNTVKTEDCAEIDVMLHILTSTNTKIAASVKISQSYDEFKSILRLEFKDEAAQSPSFVHSADPISGLRNRNFLMAELDNCISKASQGGHDSHLLYLTLDAYKTVFGEHGSEGTDLLSQQIGDFLQTFLDPELHPMSHLEDEAYGIILPSSNLETAQSIAKDLASSISKLSITLGNETLSTQCSIGIAILNENTVRSSEALSRARMAAKDIQKRDASGNGTNLYRSHSSLVRRNSHYSATEVMVDAIKHNRFTFLFQPIVPLNCDDRIPSYELLLRLVDDKGKEMQPSTFLDPLHNDKLLSRMDQWVIDKATHLLRDAIIDKRRSRLFINIAGITLRNKSTLIRLSEQLRSLRLPADHLVFQINESDALSSPEYFKAFAKALKSLQCKICLKHYGSSSESQHLLTLAKLDFIKLDPNFMKDILNQSMSLNQQHELLDPLKERDLTLIMPMVESTQIMSNLFKLGIHYVQGYYLQPPRPKMDYVFFED
ncbi:hypothetical protein DN062_00270 [Nitrincola tibetensis]|uniref:EAL domain-containing protein n=2 Tax=Nitrincola tibetensis TaxID=2219697 RepID=A0A364NRA8_9GAMM|nr:hypothetical protein DN062_00270 [Nitrincola tibetensis]